MRRVAAGTTALWLAAFGCGARVETRDLDASGHVGADAATDAGADAATDDAAFLTDVGADAAIDDAFAAVDAASHDTSFDARPVPVAQCGACAVDADCASPPCRCGVCVRPDEVCADGIDDDCDTRVDEGCGPCGDGILDPGETCDPPSSCPTSCTDDGNPCTDEWLFGSAERCDARCIRQDSWNEAPCDDGIFCNGPDSCLTGVCRHNGDPCAAGTTCDAASGRCVGCAPTFELCNGLDNDCDGSFDEPGLVCAEIWRPEVCDGIDSDFDVRVDEGLWPLDPPCGTDVGACETGVWACSCGADLCIGGIGPRAERCLGLDDDCDGRVDEDCVD